MRVFNRDGSRGQIAGNSLRNVGKYLHDAGYVSGDTVRVETDGGVRRLKLYLTDGAVSSVTVDMGRAVHFPAPFPEKQRSTYRSRFWGRNTALPAFPWATRTASPSVTASIRFRSGSSVPRLKTHRSFRSGSTPNSCGLSIP